MFTGSLVALVTPMHGDGAIDFAALDRLIDFHLEAGTDGIVVAGTTGESATLARGELIELVSHCVARIDGRIPVVAGSGTNNTRLSVELTQAVAGAGADGALLVTPYYNKPTQAGLVAHFEHVAEATDIALILYNVPSRTAVDLLPPAVERLAAHPRIVAIKDASAALERLAALRAGCPEAFGILSGDDATALAWYRAGADGAISVTANVAPGAARDVWAAAHAGRYERAAALDEALQGLHRALFVQSNPIPVKWLLKEMGMISAGIRLPLVWLDDAAAGQALRAALRTASELRGEDR